MDRFSVLKFLNTFRFLLNVSFGTSFSPPWKYYSMAKKMDGIWYDHVLHCSLNCVRVLFAFTYYRFTPLWPQQCRTCIFTDTPRWPLICYPPPPHAARTVFVGETEIVVNDVPALFRNILHISTCTPSIRWPDGRNKFGPNSDRPPSTTWHTYLTLLCCPQFWHGRKYCR